MRCALGATFPEVVGLYGSRNPVDSQVTSRRLTASQVTCWSTLESDLCTLVNASGFEIDVIRRVAGGRDEHPMRASSNEDDLWPVQVPSGDKLLGATPFEQIVVASTGEMARMRTIHPADFARVKRELGGRKDRDALKTRKDLLQAELIEQLTKQYLPEAP